MTMAEATGKNFLSRLPFLLVAICIILASSQLYALQHDSGSGYQNSISLFAHSHHPQQRQPSIRPADNHMPDTILLQVTGARLHCSENECSHHHQDCALEIEYQLSSVFKSDLNIGAQVICHARLEYSTSHGYQLQSERCSTPVEHTLQKNDHIAAKITVDFLFSPYEEVVDANVGAIQCSIEQTNMLTSQSHR